MREEVFAGMLEEVYATFGQSAPSASSPVRRVIWDVCQEMPDKMALVLKDKFQDMDALPRNMSKTVREIWHEWRERTGSVAALRKCTDCDLPGMIYVWRRMASAPETGEALYQRAMTLCACHPSGQGKTKAELEQEGFLVMPKNFTGGLREYERCVGIKLYRNHAANGGQMLPGAISKSLKYDRDCIFRL